MWAKKYNKCRKCGTTEIIHAGYGYCRKCYYLLPEVKEKQKEYVKNYFSQGIRVKKRVRNKKISKMSQEDLLAYYQRELFDLKRTYKVQALSRLRRAIIDVYVKNGNEEVEKIMGDLRKQVEKAIKIEQIFKNRVINIRKLNLP